MEKKQFLNFTSRIIDRNRQTVFERKRRSLFESPPTYRVHFDICNTNGKHFNGAISIELDLSKKVFAKISTVRSDLKIDYKGKIESIYLNKKKLSYSEHYHHTNDKISFTVNGHKEFRIGTNRIRVEFQSRLSSTKSGRGLQAFVDPLDGEIYLLTPPNPFEPHEVFPCFNQLDIPAFYQISIQAPRQWSIVTATKCTSRKTIGNTVLWRFQRAVPFAPKLLPILAGPFDQWKGPPPRDGKIPMTLYTRKSLREMAQWWPVGFPVRHPRDFDFFRKQGRAKSR
jgi:aminopeptidase N